MNATVYSAELAKQMVWLSRLLPYAHCEQVFERIGECFIPSNSIWRQTQRHGECLQTYVGQGREQVSVERVVLPDARYDHEQRKAVSMVGGMVNIRGEGWRELKVGAVLDVEIRLQRNPQTQQLDEMAHGVNVHYTAVLGTKDEFTPALWALAVEHDLPTAKERAVVADGAAWIWDVAEAVCPDGRQIVDWFHTVQHLTDAATALYPGEQESKSRTRWLTTYKDHLYMGRIHQFITALHQRGRDDLAGYLNITTVGCNTLNFERRVFRLAPARWKVGSKGQAALVWNRDALARGKCQPNACDPSGCLGPDFDTLCRAA